MTEQAPKGRASPRARLAAKPVLPRALEISQLRALVALLTERSVSRAAESVGQSQPQMSASLARMRLLLKDPILVRTNRGMAPTDHARTMLEPARRILADMQLLVADPETFDPRTMRRTLRLAIPDFISAEMLGAILGALRAGAPEAPVVVVPVRGEASGADLLESGQADLLIESTLIRSGTLRHASLFDDTLLAVAARGHPQVRPDMLLDDYLALPHVAAAPLSGARPGLVDRLLADRGHARRVVAWVPYLNTLPHILARSDLVLTTSGHMARQFAAQADLQLFAPPLKLPRIRYFLMWHERVQRSGEHRWLRMLIQDAVAAQVRQGG